MSELYKQVKYDGTPVVNTGITMSDFLMATSNLFNRNNRTNKLKVKSSKYSKKANGR